MNILDVQNVHDNILVVQQLKFDTGDVVERIKRPATVVGICHDNVNDAVMLIKAHPCGSMMDSEHFPTAVVNNGKPSHEVLQRAIEESTGATVKAVQYVQSYMDSPDFSYSPVQLFYVNFDSRTVEPTENIRLTTGKELYQEVTSGEHNDINVIHGAHYLKMMHNNLIK